MNEVQFAIIISLASLGFFGGIGHCGFMCGPFVLMQVNSNLKNINIEDITYFQKLRGMALLPYHFGRVTTYSLLGFLSATIGKNIKLLEGSNFVWFGFLILGALLIFDIIIKNLGFSGVFRVYDFKFIKFPALQIFFKSIFDRLFKNPTGVRGYILGVLLGFIPCGLLYSALIISVSLEDAILAFLGMMIFGICTTPSLFASAVGGYLFFSKIKKGFKFFTQFILLINMIVVIIMALSQIELI